MLSLSEPIVVDIDIFELGLKFCVFLSNESNRLFVIAIDGEDIEFEVYGEFN